MIVFFFLAWIYLYPDTKEFLVSLLTIDRDTTLPANDQTLTFNGDYSNPQSSAYMHLENRVCESVSTEYSQSILTWKNHPADDNDCRLSVLK